MGVIIVVEAGTEADLTVEVLPRVTAGVKGGSMIDHTVRGEAEVIVEVDLVATVEDAIEEIEGIEIVIGIEREEGVVAEDRGDLLVTVEVEAQV